jgi:hypothetical protein
MKAFQNKISGLWKWGINGEYKYKTEKECRDTELKLLTERLTKIKEDCLSSKIQISF